MSKIVKKNQPCLDSDCGSSDARQIYEGGTSFCFSCQKFFSADKKSEETPVKSPSLKRDPLKEIEEIKTFQIRGFKERGITKRVCEFFDVRVAYDPDTGNINKHYYPYDAGASYKVRVLPKAGFFWINATGFKLFGKERFPGGGKRVVLVEGEIDALSVAQSSIDKYDKIYPIVALSSSTGSEALIPEREWFRSFQEIVVWMDNDKAGDEALARIVKILGVDKLKVVQAIPECKDANDVLVKFGSDRVNKLIWDAQQYTPAGVISPENLWKALEEYNSKKSVPYPVCLDGLNTKLKGMRKGEITLFVSGTGAGKSTMLREIGLHLTNVESTKIGIISLEETPAETARKFAAMSLYKNPSNEEISLEELKEPFDDLFSGHKIKVIDHQESIIDGRIVEQLEYLALIGCEYIFIDHITILVSEGAEGLTGNEAIDKTMNDLGRACKRHDIWIGLVSHLRKTHTGGKSFEEGRLPSLDDIRGSGSIKQVSYDIVGFARDMIAAEEVERNSIKIRVLKSRHTGLTGDVPGAYYNNSTGRLERLSSFPKESFDTLE